MRSLIIKLLHDYGALCKREGVVPRKVILTFAPCGRPKTMSFIKWLGMSVPDDVEKRILKLHRRWRNLVFSERTPGGNFGEKRW